MLAKDEALRNADRQVVTVTGPVPPGALGVVLMHEHLFIDLSVWFDEPTTASGAELAGRKIDIALLGQLRRQPFASIRDNLRLGDQQMATDEAARFRAAGGTTIVDTTPIGLKRDPLALQWVARATGLNIVMGCGYYVEPAHPSEVCSASAETLALGLIREIKTGVGDTGVRPGIIGEIGTSGVERESGVRVGDVTAQEEKVLRAAARASLQTGLAVSVHLDPRGQGGFRVFDVLREEGLPVDRIIMGHMDHVPDLEYQLAMLDRGVYVQFDNFGREYYWDAQNVYWNNDHWRVRSLAELVKRGYVKQLLISQDVALKMDLRAYGGYGYDHILVDIVPALLRHALTREDVATLMVANPAAVLPCS
jgi:phosphotriesterase-related protein